MKILSLIKYWPLVSYLLSEIGKILSKSTENSPQGKITTSEILDILNGAIPKVVDVLGNKVI